MRKVLLYLAVLIVLATPAGAQVLFSTGFEASEGYIAGNQINGQQGWVQADNSQVMITNDPAAVLAGGQSLLFTSRYGRGTTHSLSASATHVLVDVTMAKASTWAGEANDHSFFFAVEQTGLGTSGRAAQFGFYGGKLAYWSGGLKLLDPLEAGKAYRFQADVDVAAKKWALLIDGQTVAMDMALSYGSATTLNEVYAYRGYASAAGGANQYAAVDSLTVTAVPEPAGLLGLLGGLAGVAGYIRRRK